MSLLVCPECKHPVGTRFMSLVELAMEFLEPGESPRPKATMRARGQRIAELHNLKLIVSHNGTVFVRVVDVDRLAGVETDA